MIQQKEWGNLADACDFVKNLFRWDCQSSEDLGNTTVNTLTSVEQLMADLEITASRGFSVEDEEEELSVRCVGAPIYNAAGEVIAAVSITATTAELTREKLPEVGQKVSNTAAKISHRLGVFSNMVV